MWMSHAPVWLVTQLCSTLCDPINCSPPGSSAHQDSPGKNTRVGCYAFLQGIFSTQVSNPGLLYCKQLLYQLSHKGSPIFPSGCEGKLGNWPPQPCCGYNLCRGVRYLGTLCTLVPLCPDPFRLSWLVWEALWSQQRHWRAGRQLLCA